MSEKIVYIAKCGCGYENGRTDRQVLACPAHLYAGSMARPSRLMEEDVANIDEDVKPFSELRKSGLLWLINKVVFHPKGFAFALSAPSMESEPDGWKLLGDGVTPWEMGDTEAEAQNYLSKVNEILRPKP